LIFWPVWSKRAPVSFPPLGVTLIKFTHSKGRINAGLAIGAILGAGIPILAVALTGGVAAVPLTLWLGLGGAFAGLFAGNVEPKTPVERSLDADAAKAGGSDE
jgi:hypothetical protein